jgi:hypothetical protein
MSNLKNSRTGGLRVIRGETPPDYKRGNGLRKKGIGLNRSAAELMLLVVFCIRTSGVSTALVTDGKSKGINKSIVGLITQRQIARAVIDGIELFAT